MVTHCTLTRCTLYTWWVWPT